MDRRSELINEIRRKQLIQSIQEKQNAPKEADVVNDSMPEWLNPNDRSVVKNLSGNDEESIAYLQKQYPDAEFKNNGDGIIARKKGDASFGKLDPSFSPLSNPLGTIKDLWNDTKDLGYDALQAGAETAGVAGGALAGLGAGSLPAAMAGGAVGAGAASTLKQMLRQKYGLSDSFDGGEVLTDAALGGVMPAAFKGAGKAIKYGAQNIAPSLYGKMAGVSADRLSKLATNGKQLSTMGPEDALGKLSDVTDALQGDLYSRKKLASKAYDAIDGSGSVDISSAAKTIEDAISEVKSRIARNPESGAFKEELRELLATRAKYLSDNEGFTPIRMNVEDTLNLDSKLGDAIDYGDAGQGIGKGVSATEEKLAKLLRPQLRSGVNTATNGAKAAADSGYIPLIDDADFIRKYFKDSSRTQASLAKLGSGKDIVLDGGFKRLPDSVQSKILGTKDDLDVHSMFAGSNKNRILTTGDVQDTLVGKAPLEKLLGAAGLAGGYVAGGPLMGVAGGAVGRGIGKLLTSPQSVLRISRAAKAMNISAEELVKKMQANPWMMQSILGATYAGKAD